MLSTPLRFVLLAVSVFAAVLSGGCATAEPPNQPAPQPPPPEVAVKPDHVVMRTEADSGNSGTELRGKLVDVERQRSAFFVELRLLDFEGYNQLDGKWHARFRWTQHSVTTNRDGSFNFADVPAGRYIIFAIDRTNSRQGSTLQDGAGNLLIIEVSSTMKIVTLAPIKVTSR